MSMPFYVSPEQVMKDRADYARKGIARGRALIALQTPTCIVIVAENPSTTLRKVSEIYDRIAFAGVGKYNEFDQMRVAGVRAAELRGYQFSRHDVDARSLANQYAQVLAGTVLRVGWRSNLTREQAVDLAARALWEASDADAATGGPDVLRGIYPIVASIDANGWSRVPDDSLASTYDTIMREVRAR